MIVIMAAQCVRP